VCMLERAGARYDGNTFYDQLNEFFRFSTTDQKWEQLDATLATLVSGLPKARSAHGMVSVGSDLYVFGGLTRGEKGLCDDRHRLAACQIDLLGMLHALLLCLLPHLVLERVAMQCRARVW